MNKIAAITETILNLSFTTFAVYGIYVLVKWKKAAEELSKICEEIRSTEKGGVE